MFRALLIDSTEAGITHQIVDLDDDVLPTAPVTVEVAWSSLNYKDGLVLTGQGRPARDYPHVPGIDLAGTVSASTGERLGVGDAVVLTGWRVGEIWWGGYATKARVRAEWLTALPSPITPRRAMAIGTAGFTAMLAIDTLERHGLAPGDGPVLVTGASGGLGSTAVHMLSRLGYEVVASTGRGEEHGDVLSRLGARRLIDRAELAAAPDRPMNSERWAGCIDAVGGTTLAHVISEMRYGSSIAACGLAGGSEVPTNVTPFLLRAVSVLGIDSVMCAPERRAAIWNRIAQTCDFDLLDSLVTEMSLEELMAAGPAILGGRIAGRTVVRTS